MNPQVARLAKDIVTGWEVSGLGLLAVFGVLVLFYLLIKVLLRVFPPREEE